MQTKVIKNGIFEVNTLGEIFCFTNGVRQEAKIHYIGRKKNYAVVNAYINGKQKHFYVHRLIAEAFIPNPENKAQVNHIDGNPKNNKIENLEWATPAENIQHAYKIGLMNPYRNSAECLYCGELTRSKEQICCACKKVLIGEAKKLDHKAKLRDDFGSIDYINLTEKEAEYIELRSQGLSLQAIAEMCGCTRQCVSQAINSGLIKSKMPPKTSAATRNQIAKIKQKIQKKKTAMEKLQTEISIIEIEIKGLYEELKIFESSNKDDDQKAS